MAEGSGQFSLVVFLVLFQFISAAALGNAARTQWRGSPGGCGCRLASTMVWAALFGGIPFALGVVVASGESGYGWLIPLQVVIWVGTFLAVVLAGDVVRAAVEPLTHSDILMMLFGGGFLLTGVAVLAFAPAPRRGDVAAAGSIFLVGGTIFGIGLWRVWRSTR